MGTIWFNKMIPVEKKYEIYNQKIFAFVSNFKYWRHYFEKKTHLIEMLTDHNNFKYFINVPNFHGRQAR